METHRSYVVKHVDGYMVSIHFQTVKSIRYALRFSHVEDFNNFMAGFYKPKNPENYYLQEIETTYREVHE